jgi:hypothetical protein
LRCLRRIGARLPKRPAIKLTLFAATLTAQDSRKQNLVTAALADFKRLLRES